MDLELRRRFFAEEIEAIANLRTATLVEVLASVPRERFLRPGPWLVRGEQDFGAGGGGGPRRTPDDDPRHVYHNCSIAIDPALQLYNGAPGVVAATIDALELTSGARVVHVGAGLGYYSALMAHIVGETGRLLAIEVDQALAAEAAANLSYMPWVEVREGDGTRLRGGPFDAIFVNAGVTHPQEAWLDDLVPGGRLIVPLTATIPAMGDTIGKGVMAIFTKTAGGDFDARVLGIVVIYSGIRLRDDESNAQLGRALMRAPFPRFTRLRRDAHDPGPGCWLHRPGSCLSQPGGA
jgi:protein-L-isoaspartate(D-aspartate) O-methyltransferase